MTFSKIEIIKWVLYQPMIRESIGCKIEHLSTVKKTQPRDQFAMKSQ